MRRKIGILLLVFTFFLSPIRIQATENESEVLNEVNEEVFKAVDKEGNVFEIPVDEDIVIKKKLLADPTTVSYGVVNFRTKSSAAYNTYYTDANTGVVGYINGFAASDGAFIGLSSDKKRVKFMIAGMVGWVDVTEVQVLNYKDCKSVSHYEIENGYLYHYATTDLTSSNYIIQNNVGIAPSYLNASAKYYSYDGHYFYTTFEKMINDYKNNVHTNSVNPNNPYYNYYQFLPGRSLTSITAEQFNSYVPSYAQNGKMKNIGQILIDAQNMYGVNAAMMYATAVFESGWGTSALAVNKNNLFGHAAADNNPYYGANGYDSVKDCVIYHAKVVLSEGLFDPKDFSGRYYGSHTGDKSSGLSVKYASDPYWGEKIASMCWIMEKAFGVNDHSIYTLGIKESNTSYNIYGNENKSVVLFNTGTFYNYPVIILESNTLYKIQSDSTLKADHLSIVQDQGEYDFNRDVAYIEKNGIRIIQEGNHKYPSMNQMRWQKIDNVWYFMNDEGEFKTGWFLDGGYWYYLDPNDGHMVTGWLNNDFYLEQNGRMVIGWKSIDNHWYFFNEKGHKVIGWLKDNGKWYYLDQDGIMKKGFVTVNDKTYYLNEKGVMVTGWQKINDLWYMFEQNGSMITGWKKDNDKWYYMSSSGVMLTGFQTIGRKTYYLNSAMKVGWQKINESWYYFDSSGSMVTGWIRLNGYWYYLDSNGIMLTGWKEIDDVWYYFYSNGSMAINTYIGNYYVNSSGAWIN